MAFQNITPVKLGQGAVPTSTGTLYTVPVSTRTYVKDIDISNTTTSTIAVTVYLVPSGGTPGASNTLIPAMNVPAKGMLQWSGTQILNAGDTIQHVASAAGCSINASGGEAV